MKGDKNCVDGFTSHIATKQIMDRILFLRPGCQQKQWRHMMCFGERALEDSQIGNYIDRNCPSDLIDSVQHKLELDFLPLPLRIDLQFTKFITLFAVHHFASIFESHFTER
jgi:hypothetical protein